MSITNEKAREIRANWEKNNKGKICSHPNKEKEYLNGIATGDKVCITCGERFYECEEKKSFEEKDKNKKSIDLYNKLQILYVSLIGRYTFYTGYSFNGYYKCYNDRYHFIRESKDILKVFSELTLNDIYSQKYKEKNKHFYGDGKYLQSKLVLLGEKVVGFIPDFQIILSDFILYNMKDKLSEFINVVRELENRHNYKYQIKSDKEKVVFDFEDVFQRWIESIWKHKKMGMLIHFFIQKMNIIKYTSKGVEIDIEELETISNKIIEDYNFDIIKIDEF